jgi:hypothetical protein
MASSNVQVRRSTDRLPLSRIATIVAIVGGLAASVIVAEPTVADPIASDAAPTVVGVGYNRTAIRPGPESYPSVTPWVTAIDPLGEHVYVGTLDVPAKVGKIRTSDMASVGLLTLDTGENYAGAIAVDPAGAFAYLATDTAPVKVVKIRLSDFTRVSAVTLPVGTDRAADIDIDPAGAFAYVTMATGPGKISKIRLSDFTLVLTQTLSSGQNSPEVMVLDNTGTYGFVATDTDPVIVVKLRLSDLRLETSPTMASGDSDTRAMVIDPTSEYLYFATYTRPAKIVKVRTSNLQRIGAITLASGENEPWGGAMDPSGQFAYFAPDIQPGGIVKVAIPSLERVGALTTDVSESVSGLHSLVVDPAGGVLYGGTVAADGPLTALPLRGGPGVCGSLPSPFADIPSGANYELAASCLASAGVATAVAGSDGVVRYRPADFVTRAQMAAFLWRIPGAPGTTESCGLADRASIPAYARAAVCWLSINGVTVSNPFNPSTVVTRAQMAAFLWRAAGSPWTPASCGFTDEASIPVYARPATCWMKDTGITVVSTYRPADGVTRAQMANFIFRTGGATGRWLTAI